MLKFLSATIILMSTLIAEADDMPATARSLMPDALISAGASAEIPARDRIYDALIGSWDVRAIDAKPDGSRQETEGEWHFAYALEGRAVQDVWIAPARKQRSASTPKTFNRFGTTVRF